MSGNLPLYLMVGAGALFFVIVIVYLNLKKKMDSSGVREIQQLRAGTQEKNFSSEVIYQKLYVYYDGNLINF